MVNVHASNFYAVRNAILTLYGKKDYEKFLETLPEELKDLLKKEVLENVKYPLSRLTSLLNLAENRYGNGLGKFIQEVGREEAKLIIKRELVRNLNILFKTPIDVLKYAPEKIVPEIFENGRAEFVKGGKNEGTFRLGLPYLYQIPGLRLVLQHMTIGGISSLLEMKGCKNIRLKSVRLGEWEDKTPYIELTIAWEEET